MFIIYFLLIWALFALLFVFFPSSFRGKVKLFRIFLVFLRYPVLLHFPALEKEMATHSGVLAWRIPGTGEPAGLPSMRSHRVGHD